MMNQNCWQTQLAIYPYAQPLIIGWQIADHSRDHHWLEYEQALNIYLKSRDEALSQEERQKILHESLKCFQALVDKGDGHIGTGLALVRLNAELNDRSAAIAAIEQLLGSMPWLVEPLPEGLQIQVNRPFVSPTSTFDLRPVETGLGQWLQASLRESLDELERPEYTF